MKKDFITYSFLVFCFGMLFFLTGCDKIQELAKKITPDSGTAYNAEEERKFAQGTSDKIRPYAPNGASTPEIAYRDCYYSLRWQSAPNAAKYCVNWSLNGKNGTSDWIDKLEYSWLVPNDEGIMYINIYAKNSAGQSSGPLAYEVSVVALLPTELLASFANATYDRNLYGIYPCSISVGNNSIYSNWKLIYTYQYGEWDASKTDFWYQIYKNGNTVVIAFRGTPGLNILNPAVYGNWIETLNLILAGNHPQDVLVFEAFKYGEISKYIKNEKHIYITGHSLGGHLAIMAYYFLINFSHDYLVEKVEKVETFNAVGMKEKYAIDIKKYGTDKIIQQYTCCDIATWASTSKGCRLLIELIKVDITKDISTVYDVINEDLVFLGKRPEKRLQHTHSTDKNRDNFKIIENQAFIGIDAHAIKYFNPLVVMPY